MKIFNDVIPPTAKEPALLVFILDQSSPLASLTDMASIAMKYGFPPCPYSSDDTKGRYVFVIGPEVPKELLKDLSKWDKKWEVFDETD